MTLIIRCGFDDLELGFGDNPSLSYTVAFQSGTDHKVYLSIEDLPNGVSVSLSPDSAYTNFTAEAKYAVSSTAVSGTYSYTLRARADGQGDTVLSAKMTIKKDCLSSVIGLYNTSETCTIGSDYYYISVSQVPGYANRVYLTNLYNDPGFTP